VARQGVLSCRIQIEARFEKRGAEYASGISLPVIAIAKLLRCMHLHQVFLSLLLHHLGVPPKEASGAQSHRPTLCTDVNRHACMPHPYPILLEQLGSTPLRGGPE
jgi:hypothetical protein